MRQLLFLAFCIVFQYCFAYTNASLWPGKTVSVSVNASSGYTNPTWSTTNSTLQLNSSGFNCSITATAYFAGTATVKCTYNYRVGSQTYNNTVEWNYTCNDTSISISPTSINMQVGETYQLMPTYNYTLYMTPTVYYTGYDTSLISISSSGTVTAKKSGETTIYLTSNVGSNSAKCSININGGNIDNGETLNYLYDAASMTAIITGPVDKSLNTYEIPSSTWFLEDYYVKGEYSVIGLGDNAFKDCQNLTHITIPSHITSYGVQIFSGCSSLSEVILPDNMTEITKSMFLECSSMQNIELPVGIRSIREQAFWGCGALKSINLPDLFHRKAATSKMS